MCAMTAEDPAYYKFDYSFKGYLLPWKTAGSGAKFRDLEGFENICGYAHEAKCSPSILSKLHDPDMKQWASKLNDVWKSLSRKMKTRIMEFPDRTSLLPVPNPFIVPGDRFREIYYWDSYWIINGLLLCDMSTTVKGMLQNFLTLVNQFGFVPNGCRIYYTERSQPPLLIPMVESYYKHTRDLQFIQENITVMEKEYDFWMSKRSIAYKDPGSGKTYNLCVYGSNGLDGPRPEGYLQDIHTTKDMTNEKKGQLYGSIRAACESGWDFSVRWFKDFCHMDTIFTEKIAPVDLNSFMGWNERILATFYALLGNRDRSTYYTDRYEERVEALSSLMWNEEMGCWFDLDTEDKQQRQAFFLSNFTPLFTGCYQSSQTRHLASKVLLYLKKSGALDYPGGVPNSMTSHSGQQWDFPSAWPPSVHMLIEGLSSTGVAEAEEVAKDLARTWIHCNYTGWKKYQSMFEKYSVVDPGSPGGGGEYNVQKGFGWTNAVVLMLMDKYTNQITPELEQNRNA